MLASEHASHLLAKLALAANAIDEAIGDAAALAADPMIGDAVRWLSGIQQTLINMQLECIEVRFAARELRDVMPSPDSLQPRLL